MPIGSPPGGGPPNASSRARRPRESDRMKPTNAARSKTKTPRSPELPPDAIATYCPSMAAGTSPAAASASSTSSRFSERSVTTSSNALIMSCLVITGRADRSRGSMRSTSSPARRSRWNGECLTAWASRLVSPSRWAASICAPSQPSRAM